MRKNNQSDREDEPIKVFEVGQEETDIAQGQGIQNVQIATICANGRLEDFFMLQ